MMNIGTRIKLQEPWTKTQEDLNLRGTIVELGNAKGNFVVWDDGKFNDYYFDHEIEETQ